MDDMQRMMLVNALRGQQQQMNPQMNPQMNGSAMNPMQGLSQMMNGGAMGMALKGTQLDPYNAMVKQNNADPRLRPGYQGP